MPRLAYSQPKEWGLRFNGTTQSAATAATVNLSTTNKITICGRYKRNDTTISRVVLEMSSNYNVRTDSFIISIDTLGQLTCGMRDVVGGYCLWTTNVIPIGKWVHFAFTIDRTQTGTAVVVGYIDGIQDGKNTLDTSIPSGNFGNQRMYIAARDGTSLYSPISLKDIRIFGSKLTQTEIATLNGKTLNPFGSPLWWLKMNEGTSTTLTDSGSLAVNASISGRTTTGTAPSTMWIIDPVRQQKTISTLNTTSVQFNGTSDKVSITNNAALNFGTGNFTVECKLFPVGLKSPDGGPAQVVNKWSSTGWYIYLNETFNSFGINKITFLVNNYALCVTNANMTDKWYHIIASVDKSSQELFRVFVNGVYNPTYKNSVDYITNIGGTTNNALPLEFMDRQSANYTKGKLYDVRLYNRALTDDECLARYYNNENITSGRVGWWKMNEGSGTTITDSQGTNHGTLTGGSWKAEVMDKNRSQTNGRNQVSGRNQII